VNSRPVSTNEEPIENEIKMLEFNQKSKFENYDLIF